VLRPTEHRVFLKILLLLMFWGPQGFASSWALEIDNTLETEISEVGLGKETSLLRENHFGDVWQRGIDVQASLLSRFAWNEHLALVIEPIVETPREGRKVYFRKGYLRVVFFNLALKVGRDSLWWGPGEHGSLLITNNAFPFDLIELGSDQPFFLPWILRGLGSFRVDSFLTRLDEYRDYPYARLFGLRLSYNPVSALTLGISRVVTFNGRGVPSDEKYSFPEFLNWYFSSSSNGTHLSEAQIVSLDAHLRVPFWIHQRPFVATVYGELGGEEESGWIPTLHAWIIGSTWAGEAGGRPWKFVLEYAQDHVDGNPDVWYTHYIYTTGYTYRGQIIGHHMGTDANDLFTQFTFRLLSEDEAKLFWEREGSWTTRPHWRIRLGGGFEHLLYAKGPRVFIEPFVDELAPLQPGGPRSWNEVVTTGVRYQF